MSMQPDPVPENAITVIVGALDGEGRQEFTEGLGKRLHYLSMGYPDANQGLLRFVRDWLFDAALLGQDSVLAAQVQESERKIAAGEVDSMSGPQLRDLLLNN